MKTVGKRVSSSGLKAFDELQRTLIKLRGDAPFIPKGVYRFKSFEEADKWSLMMKTRKKPTRPR